MKFLDLNAQYKTIKIEIDIAIKRVLDKGIFIGGKEVEYFEKEIADFCNVKYAIGVNSGTDALFLSLKAIGIKSGDEIITTPFTFIATAEVIANLGAKPIFADINSKTFNIDPKNIEKKITKKTKAIVPVHIFGQIADMAKIMKIAKKYKLFVIEDAAQAIGAKYKNKKAGAIGNLGCFSFFPSKNLGAYGDGGMIVTNNKKLSNKIRLLKNHGSSPTDKYKNLILGTNSRLDTIQAAILRVKLKHLSKWSKKRRKKANYYTRQLKNIENIITPSIIKDNSHIFHQYTIRIKEGKRDKLRSYLEKQGIPIMIYYSLPLHLQPAFKYLGYKKSDFPEAEKASKEVLSLPLYPELKRKDHDFIIKNIKDFFKNGKKH
ncbi:transcriptional regulator [Parcubacteria bacterium DG_74_2]|nr:MAG: transcriptional regulator [Parcubacteria bacterium DG_74_2]